MARKGPKPTPTNVLRLRGSWLADVRKDEPQPADGPMVPPSWLDGKAREFWPAIAAGLESMGVAKAVDSLCFALLVDALAEYIEASEIVEREGLVQTGARGTLIPHPAVRIRSDAWRRVLTACGEFGLSPSSRVGLSTEARVKSRLENYKLGD